ncbi:hypothetical protein BDN72DRAFT_904620 [Pluteus cervinus]|uniref:Uncharacterized protein n=1 Tax=Pluteus cervinus TaxID=181527 RepID=A0ACD3A6D1_9AGAR|nr:hypothetical protein BDN72DRAFT_904620 [Pluteus cervinus]
MLIPLLAAFALLQAQAAPTSFGPQTNPTIIHTIIFGRQTLCDCGSTERTLVDIIRSCLLTIAACVYRAIHQNIPDPKASWFQRQWVRVQITLLALLAPELMIWWAMKQWMGARVIRDEVNEMNLGLKWTSTHGHFAQMGGFGRKDNENVLHPPVLLGMLKFHQLDLSQLRKITRKEIQDHSKGDILSKALVTVQTTWFVVECITRLLQKLPLTKLEVITLAFAVLNTLTYGFWWNKPLDVLCPIYLNIPGTNQPHAASSNTAPPENTTDEIQDATEASPLVDELPNTKPLDARMVVDGVGDVFSGIGGTFDAIRDWLREVKMASEGEGWWNSLWRYLVFEPVGAVFGRLQKLFEDEGYGADATHVPTFYAMEIPDHKWSLVLYLSCFIGTIFGGIHFLSWNSHFPSHVESLLWRISSIILVAEPLLVALVRTFVDSLNSADGMAGRILDFLSIFFVVFPSMLGPIAYISARICLLVLAFVTLKNVSPDVFQNISWTSYIPHL